MTQVRKGDVLGKRYLLVELIGQGGMGRVYRAEDRESGAAVAVKLVDGAYQDPRRFARFEREAQTLRKLAHPHILRYVDHGQEGESVFLVTELLEGHTLREAAGEFAGKAESVFLLGARLASAFAAAHHLGIVHRDIKPANIFITKDGEPRILDYGLARWILPDDATPSLQPTVEKLTQTDALVGTIHYMSPEQLRARPADRRSDIFSLAVTLYELAGGRRPYDGDSLLTLLEAMEAGKPKVLFELRPELGPSGMALDMVLRRALHPVPAKRFATMEDFADALERGMDLYASVPQDASLAILLLPTIEGDQEHGGLFGRDAELAILKNTIESVRAGNGATVVVEGPLGIGRSRLASEVTRVAHRQGFLCLTASVPVAEGSGKHPGAAWLEQALDVFPASSVLGREIQGSLEKLQPERSLGPADPRVEQLQATFAKLTERLPVFILLEDAERANPDLLDVLSSLVGFAVGRPIAMVVTLRTDALPHPATESALERFLSSPSVERVPVKPLPVEAVRRMAEELYPGLILPDSLWRELTARSGGNPAYARDILQFLESRGLLNRRGGEWSGEEIETIPSPPAARELLKTRLAELDRDDLEILRGAAIMGRSFQANRLAEVVDWEPLQLDVRLRLLARRHRLFVPENEGYSFDQPVTRILLLEQIPEDLRCSLHLRAAERLRARWGEAPEAALAADIALHYFEAQRQEDALPFAMRAGLLLQAEGRLDDALAWLHRSRVVLEQKLESVPEDAKEALRAHLADVALSIAECLDSDGRHTESLRFAEMARGLSTSTGRGATEAKSLLAMARSYFARGDVLQSQRRAHEALRVASRESLPEEAAVALAFEAQSLSYSGATEEAERKWRDAIVKLEELGRRSEAAEALLRMGNQFLRLDRNAEAEECYQRATALAGRRGSPRLFARIQNTRAAMMLARGRPAQALPLFQEAAALRRSIGARRGLVQSMHNVAFCHHALGDLHEARRIYEQVLAMRGEIEETVARASSQRNYAEVLFDLGRLEEALAAATEALTTKRQAEDLAYLPSCLSLIGDIESEIGRTERAREAFLEVLREFPDHPSENFHCEMGMARLEEASGKRDDAKRRYEKLLGSTARASSDAEALLAVYQALQFFREQGASSEKLREIAEPALGGRFAVDLPLAELFRSQIAASRSIAEGCVEEAKIHLREALARSWKLGMAERIWRIQRDLSMLEPKGSRAAEEELASARATVESQARVFRRKDLRSAYSAHPERAVILGGVVR